MNRAIPRRFVPADFQPTDFDAIEPLGGQLLDRPIDRPEDLRQWLADASELTCVIREHASRINIRYSAHTDDPDAEHAYMHLIQELQPKLRPLNFKLQRKFVDSPHRPALEAEPKHAQLARQWKADVEIYREQNVPIQTEVAKLVSEYDKLCGAMTVEFQGRPYTVQQMGRFLDEPDRATREAAWRAVADRRLADRPRIDELFDEVVARRQTIAENADFDDYRAYTWKSMNRFDYAPDDCHAFADAVERFVLPLVRKLADDRGGKMGVAPLRPWDTSVDPLGRAPLRPFDPADTADFVARTHRVFQRVDPRLAERFDALEMGRNLDLDSRKGKRPGGYQAALEESREPFIFMNAAGLHRDVETLLHEAGHAFHYLEASEEPIVFVRFPPLEFAEVASMSMELLGADALDEFYNPDSLQRAKRLMLEGIVSVLPWIATIDQFQHWLYTHPGHDARQRVDQWRTVYHRFAASDIDWTGLEDARDAMWQKQLHLFHAPFYYIEYGIAQLGALQVWRNYRDDPQATLGRLLDAFALGGGRPLPTLFETAGLRFDFSADTVEPLAQMLHEELDSLDQA